MVIRQRAHPAVAGDDPDRDDPDRDDPDRDDPDRGDPDSGDPEGGAATVEAAIAICGLVAVVVMALCGMLALVAELRCTDAATAAARLAARGEENRVGEAVGAVGPAGASWSVSHAGRQVRVEVTAGGLGLPGLVARAAAVADLEPGADDAP
jgi:hypothetical protein